MYGIGMNIPSMMSISPPWGHSSSLVYAQNAGQVAHPAGMCVRSSTAIESVYVRLDVMRMLFRPRTSVSFFTTLVLSARMTNLSQVAA